MAYDVGLRAILEPEISDEKADEEIAGLKQRLKDIEGTDIELGDIDLGGSGGVEGALDEAIQGGGGGGGGGAGGALEGALAGGAKGGSKGGAAGGLMGKMKGASSKLPKVALAGGVALGILKGVESGAESSSYLRKVLDMFNMAVGLFFRPFGRFLASVLEPFARGALLSMVRLNQLISEDGLLIGFPKWFSEAIINLPVALAEAFLNSISGGLEDLLGIEMPEFDLPRFRWDDFMDNPLDWSNWVPMLSWGGFIGKLAWVSYIAVLAWEYFIPNVDWKSWINPMNWDSWVSGISWGEWLSILEWTSYVVDLKWDDWVPDLSWGDWVSALNWGNWIDSLDWLSWLNPLTWADWITSIDWTGWIDDVDWTSWIDNLRWDGWVPNLNWSDFIPNLSWDKYVPGGGGGGGINWNPTNWGSASGSVVTGETMELVGEREDEAILPLSKLSGMLDKERRAGAMQSMGAGGAQNRPNHSRGSDLGKVEDLLKRLLRAVERNGGANEVKIGRKEVREESTKAANTYERSREVFR